VWPNNLPIIQHGDSAVPPGLFAPSASGRVSPLGNFTGFEDSIEYFFALALVPSQPSYAVFTKATVASFSSGCAEVAASVAYLETRVHNASLPNDGEYLSTLKQVAFWRFDKDGAVLAYDAWIPNLSEWNFLVQGHRDLSNPRVQEAVIDKICPLIQERCVGSNQQYADVAECTSTLQKKDFGTYDDAWSDSVVCRTIHVILALVRPEMHCQHVGPTGGGKCVDWPYNEGYFDDDELYAGIGNGTRPFICPKKKKCHERY